MAYSTALGESGNRDLKIASLTLSLLLKCISSETWPMQCQTCGYLPSFRALPSIQLVPNYTASWHRQVCLSGLPRALLESVVGETWSRDLSTESDGRSTTRPSRHTSDNGQQHYTCTYRVAASQAEQIPRLFAEKIIRLFPTIHNVWQPKFIMCLSRYKAVAKINRPSQQWKKLQSTSFPMP